MFSDDTDGCESDREIACPIKRRRQELHPPLEDDYQSLSRSSSLLQFETLEKQCQETSSSSPSIYSQFSVDSLEKKSRSQSSSSSGDSSDTTIAPRKPPKTWRSFESLPLVTEPVINNQKTKSRDGFSAENLSEDSGYSDHLSSLNSSLKSSNWLEPKAVLTRSFIAYDYCEAFPSQNRIGGGNLGASCQNLTLFADSIGDWMRTGLEKTATGDIPKAKNTASCSSEPNLHLNSTDLIANNNVVVSSVPRNLNVLCCAESNEGPSIAEKNFDLTHLTQEMAKFKREGSYAEAMANRVDLSDDEQGLCYKQKLPKTPLVEFDRKILSSISESLRSINSQSVTDAYLDALYSQEVKSIISSTPNLTLNRWEEERLVGLWLDEERRKSTQELQIKRKASPKVSKDLTKDYWNKERKTDDLRKPAAKPTQNKSWGSASKSENPKSRRDPVLKEDPVRQSSEYDLWAEERRRLSRKTPIKSSPAESSSVSDFDFGGDCEKIAKVCPIHHSPQDKLWVEDSRSSESSKTITPIDRADPKLLDLKVVAEKVTKTCPVHQNTVEIQTNPTKTTPIDDTLCVVDNTKTILGLDFEQIIRNCPIHQEPDSLVLMEEKQIVPDNTTPKVTCNVCELRDKQTIDNLTVASLNKTTQTAPHSPEYELWVEQKLIARHSPVKPSPICNCIEEGDKKITNFGENKEKESFIVNSDNVTGFLNQETDNITENNEILIKTAPIIHRNPEYDIWVEQKPVTVCSCNFGGGNVEKSGQTSPEVEKRRFSTNIPVNKPPQLQDRRCSENLDKNIKTIETRAQILDNLWLEQQKAFEKPLKLTQNDDDKNQMVGGAFEKGDTWSAKPLIRRKPSLVDHSSVSDYETGGSSKGVHFSPVVSEVNWQNDDGQSTPSTIERESSSSPDLDHLTYALLDARFTPPPPAKGWMGGSQPVLNQHQSKTTFQSKFSKSQPDVSKLKRKGSLLVKKDDDGCVIKAYVDFDGVHYKHTHLDLDNVYGGEPSSPPPIGGHVTEAGAVKHRGGAVGVMEVSDAVRDKEATRTRPTGGKLGGFFSRLASFRFSSRKHDEKKRKKVGGIGDGGKKTAPREFVFVDFLEKISRQVRFCFVLNS